MEVSINNCILCDNPINETHLNERDVFHYNCATCGEISISEEAKDRIEQEYKSQRHLLSGFTRERSEKGLKPTDILTPSLEQIFSSEVPKSVPDKLDRLLLRISEKSDSLGENFLLVTEKDYPLGYSKSPLEFRYMIDYLIDQELMVREKNEIFSLKFNGWKRVEELKKQPIDSKRCFVAMSFDKKLDKVYDDGIKHAIKAAGYEPIRIDRIEHVEKICDKIIVEIRNSRFLVADVTQQKQGVYFEAGFAMGLDIPVIWTCREDDMKNAHFDTRQYNHILWKTPEDLKEQLTDRILAKIGSGK